MAIFTLPNNLPDGSGGFKQGIDPHYPNSTFAHGATSSWRNLEM